MPAVSELPELARKAEWITETTDPDFFGDVRATAWNGLGDRIVMAFKDTGELAGGYLFPRRGCQRHTERAGTVKSWLNEYNGEVAIDD